MLKWRATSSLKFKEFMGLQKQNKWDGQTKL